MFTCDFGGCKKFRVILIGHTSYVVGCLNITACALTAQKPKTKLKARCHDNMYILYTSCGETYNANTNMH